MAALNVTFSVTAAERREFSDIFFGGLGITSLIFVLLGGWATYWLRCRRLQVVLAPLALWHTTLFWWAELGVRLLLVTAWSLLLAW